MNISPDPDVIAQAEEEDYNRPIAVTVCGPVESRELPATRPGYKTEQAVGTAVGVKILPFEPRRKTAVIMPIDQDIWISSTQAGAQAGASSSFRVSAVVPFTIDHMEEVWACAVTGTTDISVASSFWSE